jgi:hypothetical protein
MHSIFWGVVFKIFIFNILQMLFWQTNFEDGHCPSPGRLLAAPYLVFPKLSFISYVKLIEKYIALELWIGE